MNAADWDVLGRVLLVGCGNMGGAMLSRWIAAGLPTERVTVLDPGNPPLPAGVGRGKSAAGPIDTMILAVKPQQLQALAAGGALANTGATLAVSILAGVTLAGLAAAVPGTDWVRAMPNLPVAIGQGVVALHGPVAEAQRNRAETLMTPLGLVEWIDAEDQFDAVTALSGCGPGFVFRFVDALAAAGANLGLPEDQARRLAIATVEGAAAMAAESDASPATLADRVASPGGSTREGLNVLDDGDALKRLLAATLAASARRNAELAALAG